MYEWDNRRTHFVCARRLSHSYLHETTKINFQILNKFRLNCLENFPPNLLSICFKRKWRYDKMHKNKIKKTNKKNVNLNRKKNETEWLKLIEHENQLTLKCTASSAWMHCKEKKQKNQLAVKCMTRRSALLKLIFRKNYCVTFMVWFDFCFTALRHILGHFGRGQLT